MNFIRKIKNIILNRLAFEQQEKLSYLRGKLTKRSLEFVLCRIFPIQNNKIVFCNMWGNGYGDNPKYITEELIKTDMYDLVWLVKDIYDKSLPDGVRKVKYGSFKAVYELSTARIWVDNARKYLSTIKKKSQYYIHTGHGGVPLKRVEADAPLDNLGAWYVATAKHDSKLIDLIITNSKFKTQICEQSYWYHGEIVEWGSPKIEALKKKDKGIEDKVRKSLHIEKDVNIALYAPTFRKDVTDLSWMISDFRSLRNTLIRAWGGKWIILARLHPNCAEKAVYAQIEDEEVIEASSYPDMQELLTASEILITDYSGTMFEMMQIGKAVFLYTPDRDFYERGSYFEWSELPFPLSVSEKQLNNQILNFSMDDYFKRYESFKKRIGLVEKNNSAKECAQRIHQVVFGV